ncbi:sarcalumenin-like [Parasteatoda tepidariorum]|uniref:sarcalumenin-like n=1 Tax=Parasteatoda tepidariorum TaxID=114398 RepID=UPI001C720A20|nr:sarcalumenin-like [Parasteatoda tepidariorum]
MMPLKWSIILFLGGITFLGLPTTAESDDPSKDTKSSSASECRVHIEKALEQYWDQPEPSDPNNPHIDQNNNIQQQKNDDDAPEIQEQNENSDEDEEDEDVPDNDDEEEEQDSLETETQNNSSKDSSSNEETNNVEEEDEEDEEDDETSEVDEDTEDEESNENEVEENKADDEQIDENDEEDEEEEEEDDQEDEISEKESVSNLSDSKNVSNNIDNIEEEDDDDDDDEEDENEHDLERKEETQEENEKVEISEESETNEIVDNTEIEEEEEDDDGDDDEEPDEEVEDSQSDEIKIEIKIESDKVIGEADRASTGMASEFHDEKPPLEQPQATKTEEKNVNASLLKDDEESQDFDAEDSELEINDENDDTIENIYEEEDESTSGITYRSRDHIDVILGFDEIATEYDNEEEKLAQSIFKEIKKIYLSQIKPIEMLYKYADSTTRVLGDAEIFNKPMLIFLGPWNGGKTTIINYLLGTERTPNALKTGTGITDTDFTLITYGETHRIRSGTELAADWRYAGVQRFGQDFLDHFRGVEIKHTLLKKITIVDTPGILENKKTAERGYSLSDAFQWFIDRSDAIYVVLDPSKVDIGAELGSVVDQLKGRDARFLLNKADTIRRSDLMRVVGQLFWNLSPLMSSTEAPLIYAVSLTTKPFHPSAPAKFLADQEKNYFYDMKDTLDKRVENRILYARRHAVRVRNHAKMIDCYLATYYRHKSIFSNKRNVAKSIIENPHNYNLFDGFGGMTNVSRYDLPNPSAYKEFFKLHPLYDFKPLASTCSYFRGCPMDKLDLAISKDIPELLAKYKKTKQTDSLKHNR